MKECQWLKNVDLLFTVRLPYGRSRLAVLLAPLQLAHSSEDGKSLKVHEQRVGQDSSDHCTRDSVCLMNDWA